MLFLTWGSLEMFSERTWFCKRAQETLRRSNRSCSVGFTVYLTLRSVWTGSKWPDRLHTHKYLYFLQWGSKLADSRYPENMKTIWSISVEPQPKTGCAPKPWVILYTGQALLISFHNMYLYLFELVLIITLTSLQFINGQSSRRWSCLRIGRNLSPLFYSSVYLLQASPSVLILFLLFQMFPD